MVTITTRIVVGVIAGLVVGVLATAFAPGSRLQRDTERLL
jgi:hypothetical protein